jgi:hypothetical protein
MRAAAGLALLLAACSPRASGAPVAEGALIDCALGGAASFSHDCTVERTVDRGATVLVVRHPDGGFRRFKVVDSGQSLTAADGAEALAFARAGDRVDVSVGGDRYRFPGAMLSDDAGR